MFAAHHRQGAMRHSMKVITRRWSVSMQEPGTVQVSPLRQRCAAPSARQSLYREASTTFGDVLIEPAKRNLQLPRASSVGRERRIAEA